MKSFHIASTCKNNACVRDKDHDLWVFFVAEFYYTEKTVLMNRKLRRCLKRICENQWTLC